MKALAVGAVLLLLLLAFPRGPVASVRSHYAVRPAISLLGPTTGPATCLTNASITPPVSSKLRVAVVKPTFTSTPYSTYPSTGFYAFYHKYVGITTGNVTTDLGWLNTSTTVGSKYNGGWGLSSGLYSFFTSDAAARCGFAIGKNTFFLSDVSVSDGALFSKSGDRKYDVVVIGFSEYVTMEEYRYYKEFVASGGRLVMVSSDSLEVRVHYYNATAHEALVKGHGWAFNGKSAWPSVSIPWDADSVTWIASTHCCLHLLRPGGATVNASNPIGGALQSYFGNKVFTSYVAHEENFIRNTSHTSVIASFGNLSGHVIAAYIHQYRRGDVVSLGVFGDDIIAGDSSAQYAVVLAASTYPLGTPIPVESAPVISVASTVLALVTLAVIAAVFMLANRRARRAEEPQAEDQGFDKTLTSPFIQG